MDGLGWELVEERKKELEEYRVGGAVVLDQVSFEGVLAENGWLGGKVCSG